MAIKDLLQERGEVVAAMHALIDSAEKEGRDFSSDEQAKYELMNADQEALKSRADRMKSAAELQDALESAPRVHRPNVSEVASNSSPFSGEGYKAGFDRYARYGKNALDAKILGALQVGTDSEGGYIVPEEFETVLTKALLDHNEIRQYAKVITTGSDRNIPIEATKGVATWTAEEAAYTDSDPSLGQVILGAHKLGRIVKVSEELLQDAFFDVPGWLATNFGETFGTAEEAAFVAGTGTTHPTGIVTGSSLGVTSAAVAAITSDELINLFHSLGRPYRRNAVWMMKDSTALLVRKLKDTTNQYLWQPGLQAGQPDMLLGRPVITSVSMPAATAALKAVVFGDLNYYTIADRKGMTMQRLNELYAANGQVGFRGYKRTEGKVTLSAAIKHLIQA
jgi:HK97 family phage major capsid protein